MPLAAIKARVAGGERHFEGLLKRHLIDNRHRTVLLLQPDRDQAEREAREERARLEAARAGMTARRPCGGSRRRPRPSSACRRQPDSPEALATIPTLTLVRPAAREQGHSARGDEAVAKRACSTTSSSPTGSSISISALICMRCRPSSSLTWPCSAARLLETGVGGDDFVRLSQRIGRSTGGIRPQRWMSTIAGGATCRGMALPARQGAAGPDRRAAGDPCGHPRARAARRPRARFQQLVLEEKASLESRLVPAGSSYVDRRLRASLYESDWADEQMGGVSYLFFLRKLAGDLDGGLGRRARRARTHPRHSGQSRQHARATSPPRPRHWAQLQAAARRVSRCVAGHGGKACALARRRRPRFRRPHHSDEGQLRRQGRRPLSRLASSRTGRHLVARRYLRTTWLWDQIRVQGGAYGGQCMLDRYSGGFTFVSYRDPNLIATLDIYDRTADFLQECRARARRS